MNRSLFFQLLALYCIWHLAEYVSGRSHGCHYPGPERPGDRADGSIVPWNPIHQFCTVILICLSEPEVSSCPRGDIFQHTPGLMALMNMSSTRVQQMSWLMTTTVPSSTQPMDYGVLRAAISGRREILTTPPPADLEILDISYTHFHMYPQTILNHVGFLDSGVGLYGIIEPVYCKHRPVILQIDVSNSMINYVHTDAFTKCNWTSIQRLNLSYNILSGLLITQGPRPFFRSLPQLSVSYL